MCSSTAPGTGPLAGYATLTGAADRLLADLEAQLGRWVRRTDDDAPPARLAAALAVTDLDHLAAMVTLIRDDLTASAPHADADAGLIDPARDTYDPAAALAARA